MGVKAATNGIQKHLFLSNFDPHLLIVDSVFYCRLPGVGYNHNNLFVEIVTIILS